MQIPLSGRRSDCDGPKARAAYDKAKERSKSRQVYLIDPMYEDLIVDAMFSDDPNMPPGFEPTEGQDRAYLLKRFGSCLDFWKHGCSDAKKLEFFQTLLDRIAVREGDDAWPDTITAERLLGWNR